MSYKTAQAGPSSIGTWLLHASATTAGVVLGGILLGLMFRLYLSWSVRDSLEKANPKNTPAAVQPR